MPKTADQDKRFESIKLSTFVEQLKAGKRLLNFTHNEDGFLEHNNIPLFPTGRTQHIVRRVIEVKKARFVQ